MRLSVRSALVGFASLATVSGASAASLEDKRSSGQTSLKWETRNPIVGPKSDKIGNSTLSVQVSVNLDPLADPTKPLLSVDMPEGVVVQASWKDDKSIELEVVDSTAKAGEFKIEHTLAPHVTLFLNAFGFNLTYDYNAATLIQHVPGSNWSYVGLGVTNFEPWGFQGAVANVVAPSLNNAQLFSIPLSSLGGQTLLTGNIALNATTSPTFGYETTSVVLQGGTPVTKSNRVWSIPTTDADFIDVKADASGLISYFGSVFMRPSVTITKIGNVTIPGSGLTLDVAAAGVEVPFQTDREPIPVDFPQATLHIPLPNVKAPKALDLGDVQVGTAGAEKAEIANTGEMSAAMTFTSDNAQFAVVSGKQSAGPKGKYELEVAFSPTEEGPQSAKITVTSNDPNEPVQVIEVTGNGTARPTSATPPSDGLPESEPDGFGPQDSGCGCRTAPAPSSAAGFGLLGLGLAALLRRRRRA
jgi:MYXO-CTERM domain-containing protein